MLCVVQVCLSNSRYRWGSLLQRLTGVSYQHLRVRIVCVCVCVFVPHSGMVWLCPWVFTRGLNTQGDLHLIHTTLILCSCSSRGGAVFRAKGR